jgi:hypothetical protein
MISFEEAKSIALAEIDADCALLDEVTLEKPYGWYFCFQSKRFLETGDFRDSLVGSGGFIVEKADGRIFRFGSAYPLERNLRAYEAGFKFELYDLIVKKVRDIRQATLLLNKLDMTYVVPEVEHGVEWKIPKRYTEKQIKQRLEKLPATFEKQKFYFRFEVFEEINLARCCEYEIQEHSK